MLRFYAMSFSTVIANLDRAEMTIISRLAPSGTVDDDIIASNVEEAISGLADSVEDLPISDGVQAQVEELVEATEDRNLSVEEAQIEIMSKIETVKRGVVYDLSSPLCLMIEQRGMRTLYEHPIQSFGQQVAEEFPETKRDIEAGSQCLALEQWTASVFHMMRVVEHGLRAIAEEIDISLSTEIEYQNWHNIIEKIESEIRDKQQKLPKGKEKSDRLQFLTEVAGQFWHFKEAWRNHVAHSRATYDKNTALKVYRAVRSVMIQLAERE